MMEGYQLTDVGYFPNDWEFGRIDEYFSIQQGKSVSKANRIGENQKPFLRTSNLLWGKVTLDELDYLHFSKEEETKFKLEFNDLLVCEGGDIGRTAIWKNELEGCYYQNHLHRVRAKIKDIDPVFVLNWMQYAFIYAKVYFGRGNITTIPNLSKSRLSEFTIPKPPLPEQRKIAYILSKVQKAIEQQDKLIRHTTELKKALMQKLFTEGTKGEKQKQTEIGLVPESWEVKSIGTITDVTSGGTPSRKEKTYWENGTIPWVKTGEVNYCVINDSEEYITELGLKNSSAKLYPKGTLLIAMYGQGITRGKVAILGINATINQACAAIVPKKGMNVLTEYLYYFFEHHYDFVRNLSHGANQKNLSGNIIKEIDVTFPKDLAEQKFIISTLKAIDNRKLNHQRKKQTLSNLFKTLLHELMTGERRVHEIEFEALTKAYKTKEQPLSMAAEK